MPGELEPFFKINYQAIHNILFLQGCPPVGSSCGMELIQPKIKILKRISSLCLTSWELVAQRNSYPKVKSPKQSVHINAPEDKLQQLRSIKYRCYIQYCLVWGKQPPQQGSQPQILQWPHLGLPAIGIWATMYLRYTGGTDHLLSFGLCIALRSRVEKCTRLL